MVQIQNHSILFHTHNDFLMDFKIKISFRLPTDTETEKQGETAALRASFPAKEISDYLFQMEMLI